MCQAIVPSVPVTARTVLGEQLGALRLGVGLEQVQRGGIDPLVLGQLDCPFSIAMVVEQGLEIGRAVPPGHILVLGQIG